MTMRQWILVGLITACAIALINARYHERRLYGQMDRAERLGLKLDSDIEMLQVELTALRTPGRIDLMARRELKMVPLKPTETFYVLRAPKADPLEGFW